VKSEVKSEAIAGWAIVHSCGERRVEGVQKEFAVEEVKSTSEE
jgi:hypothetical protein